MYYKSIDDMNHAILRGLQKIPQDVDLVVGIPRSGLLAGNMVSLYKNLPLTDLNGLGAGRLLGNGKRPLPNNTPDVIKAARKILVIDDCVSRGTEMFKTKKKIEEWGLSDRVVYATVFCFPERPDIVDIIFEMIPRPMCFQWSCMHTPELGSFCVDIDGVLCADPTPDQDDDGAKYLDFLENAKPLFTPTVEIGWLVTCRLEKYRAQTEAWMAKHNIKYRELVMMDFPDKESRDASKSNVKYKSDIYKSTGAELFIESDHGMAMQIAELSEKPVMSMHNGQMFSKPASEQLDMIWLKIQWWKRRIFGLPKKVLKKVGLA